MRNIEHVWIDFGKQHTNIQDYDPEDQVNNEDGELKFKGH